MTWLSGLACLHEQFIDDLMWVQSDVSADDHQFDGVQAALPALVLGYKRLWLSQECGDVHLAKGGAKSSLYEHPEECLIGWRIDGFHGDRRER